MIDPHFRPISLEDRSLLRELLWNYQPETSELSFTDLYCWRKHYQFMWCYEGDYLLIVGFLGGHWFGLPPVGPSPRTAVCLALLDWLRESKGETEPVLLRVDERTAGELSDMPELLLTEERDQFDYLYRNSDLIALFGKNYHGQLNHINFFRKHYPFRYLPLEESLTPACLEMMESWCRLRRCEEDLGLLDEWEALRQALQNYRRLGLDGAAIEVEGRLEAFTLGDMLNEQTALIHFEKANPELRGLYPLINQQFAAQRWTAVPYINREQDLGEPGLRQAKMGYHPVRLVKKFRLTLGTT